MASINDIHLENTYSEMIMNKKKILQTNIYIGDVVVGELVNGDNLICQEEYFSDLYKRSKDYLTKEGFFHHDLLEVCQMIDERLLDKVIITTINDLAILDDLQYIYRNKVKQGQIALRTSIDKKPVIFRDNSDFMIYTDVYRSLNAHIKSRNTKGGRYR